MKQAFTFCLLVLCSTGLLAQDWTLFPYDQKSWFEFENEEHYSQSIYYADSLEEDGNTNNYYFYLAYLDNLLNTYDSTAYIQYECLDSLLNGTITGFDFLQARTEDFVFIREPLQEINGQYYFKGNLVFDATLQVGGSIMISSADYVGFDEVKMTCTSQTGMNIYGNLDYIKTFSLQAFSGGQAIVSNFDNHTYILSETYGLVEFLPFNELLTAPKTTAKLLGFENENEVIQGKKAWTIVDFVPYEAGDVIYYVDWWFDDTSSGATNYSVDSITSKTVVGDTISYTYYRLSSIDGNLVDSTEYTETIIISTTNSHMFDKGIYKFDLEENNWSWLEGLSLVDIDASKSDFYVEEDMPSYDISIERSDELPILTTCGFDTDSDPYISFDATYNTQLGKTRSSNSNAYEVNGWKLLLYRKGNQEIFNDLTIPLEDNYSCTDDSVLLQNNIFTPVTYSGVGVEGNVFYPSLVPEALYNTPLEITYFMAGYVFNDCDSPFLGSCDSLILSETVIVDCEVTGDCALSNFTAIPSSCNAYGGITIDIDFDFVNVGGEGFVAIINGEEYGPYSYQTLYENGTIPVFVIADGSTNFDIFVKDKENATCTTNTITIPSADCTDDICIFSNVMVTPSSCDAYGNYTVEVSFDYQGLTGDSFAIYQNSVLQGYYDYEDFSQNGPIAFTQNLIGDGRSYEFEIVDDLWTECSSIKTITVNCLTELCGIENIYFDELTDDICEEDGIFYVDFDHNPNTVYDLVWVVNHGDSIYREEGVQPPFETILDQVADEESIQLLITDSENPCCLAQMWYYGNNSGIGDGCYTNTVLNDFPTIAYVNFQPVYGIEKINNDQEFLIHFAANTTIPLVMYHGYTVLVNGVEMGDYRIPEDTELTFGPFPADGTTEYILEVKALCDNQTGVKTLDIGVVGSGICSYGDYSITVPTYCAGDEFSYRIYHDYEGESTGCKVYVNGEYYGVKSYQYTSFQVGPFFGDGETVHTFDIYDLSNQCSFTISEVAKACIDKVDVTVSAFLEGAYDPTTQSMNASLDQAGILPTTQPYNVPPWNYNGTETAEEFPAMVVDWVLVEMRSGVPNLGTSTTTVIETKAGLLLSNGTVVNPAGQPLRFEQLDYDTAYYICLRHRNHLDVLSAVPVVATPENMSYDFRTSSTFGTNQQKVATDGNYVLFGGDYVPDGIIQNSDNDAWKASPAILNTYTITDGTLDGIVQLTDQDVWLPNKAKIGVVEIRY